MCVWGGSDLNDFPAVGDARSLSLSLNQIKLPSVIPPHPHPEQIFLSAVQKLGRLFSAMRPPAGSQIRAESHGFEPRRTVRDADGRLKLFSS